MTGYWHLGHMAKCANNACLEQFSLNKYEDMPRDMWNFLCYEKLSFLFIFVPKAWKSIFEYGGRAGAKKVRGSFQFLQCFFLKLTQCLQIQIACKIIVTPPSVRFLMIKRLLCKKIQVHAEKKIISYPETIFITIC